MTAPQTYTVTTVRDDDKGRPLVVLEGVKEELGVWVPKNEQRPDITAQQEIKGWINEGKDGGRYFRPATGGNQGTSNGAQSAQDDEPGRFDRKPDHPTVEARAKHSTSLGAAPAYYELLRTEGVLDKAESKEKALETLKGLIRWLEDTYPQPDAELPFS